MQYLKLFSFLSLLFIFSCTKEPGEGGTSTITGKVYIMNYDGAGNLIGEFYAPEERVYIIYGDEDFYGDDTRTQYDGTYAFHFLQKGKYTVYAYSDCDTCASTVEPILITTEITKNHSTIELPDLILKK